MIIKTMLLLSAAAVIALPAPASARNGDGERKHDRKHYRDGKHDWGKKRDRNAYAERAYGRGYADPYYRRDNRRGSYGRRYYGGDRGYAYPAYGYGAGYGYPSYNSGYARPYGYGGGGYGGYGYPQGYGYGGYQGDYRYDRRRCGNGTAGAVVGGLAGAAIGSQVAGGGRDRYYRRNNDRTTGALIGGALGAVVGSAVARGNC